MVRITHAVLHVFDTDTGSCLLSDRELDLGERTARTYVQRIVRKAVASPENGTARLTEGHGIAHELMRYASGQREFVDLSQDIARMLWESLRASETMTPCDLLVVDFTDTEHASATALPSAEGDPDGADTREQAGRNRADAECEDRMRRLFAVVVLARRKAFAHEFTEGDGSLRSDLLVYDALLPNPTQKLSQYALVDLTSGTIELVDEEIQIAGRSVPVLSETLFACTAAPSPHEVLDTVVRLVGTVAEEYGRSPIRAMADAKDYLTHSAQQTTAFAPSEVGEHVFAADPTLAERFDEVLQGESLPEAVSVRPTVANRLAKNHRIRTDTGIDIIFPSAYAADQHFIAFDQDENGGIQITIRAARIESR